MPNKKKVLFCITKGNFGGAQRYVFDLATNLPKNEFDVLVACGEGNTLAEKLGEAGIRSVRINNLGREIKTLNDFKVCKELVDLIRAERPNIIHLNSSKIGAIGAVAGRISAILEKSYNPKIIFTSHGWGFYEKHRSFLSRLFYYLSHWLTVILCHETIAVSEKTKRDIDFLPFIKKKIVVIHNGISNFKMLTQKAAREVLRAEKNQTVLFSISELHPNKGLDIALKGISLLPDQAKKKVTYYIAGSGESEGYLKKMSEDLDLSNQVFFLGFVPEAKSLLPGADIFLFPSRTENLPFAVLEAGLGKLPVIATSVGGIPEIIKDMQNGILIYPKNPKEIAEAILYLLEHREKRKEFGEALKQTVSNFFSFDKMFAETMAIYKN